MNKEIPKEIKDLLNVAGQKYSESPATTDAGRVLRFLARFITVDTIIKVLAHKLK
ncbi:hypothetical protein GKZ90_0021115 [Flavobacterium sp. MC2016-06]|jgi:hypothetical protein|uniref:hypothetical protein n=1 Tax=Flavobacterium sp. MC2016-06 TaxID=2676308 RepID=UPI0012BAB5B9|nr:hypothetical protein [Flavobacterium sp. MC2016-06]MBU3861002.1 hypothetical protein [Flavobacterium sp. MC2016-06]